MKHLQSNFVSRTNVKPLACQAIMCSKSWSFYIAQRAMRRAPATTLRQRNLSPNEHYADGKPLAKADAVRGGACRPSGRRLAILVSLGLTNREPSNHRSQGIRPSQGLRHIQAVLSSHWLFTRLVHGRTRLFSSWQLGLAPARLFR